MLNRNIVLIGMPGCGKSSIGKMLAEKLNMEFYDIDSLIEEGEGISVAEIFAKYGEKYFRKLEAIKVREVSQYKSVVISTGGGVVKFVENMKYLKESGKVFFIERDIEEIAKENMDGRPLLNGDKLVLLKNLHDERIVLYNRYADYTVRNDKLPEDAVDLIEAKWRYYENSCN